MKKKFSLSFICFCFCAFLFSMSVSASTSLTLENGTTISLSKAPLGSFTAQCEVITGEWVEDGSAGYISGYESKTVYYLVNGTTINFPDLYWWAYGAGYSGGSVNTYGLVEGGTGETPTTYFTLDSEEQTADSSGTFEYVLCLILYETDETNYTENGYYEMGDIVDELYFVVVPEDMTSKSNQTVTASAASSTIIAGKTTQITANGIGTITYSSNNTSVATVNSTGLVTGVAEGSAEITVKAAGNSSYNAGSTTVTITVVKANQTLTVSTSSTSFDVGNTAQITASGIGDITYSSSDTSIATVSDTGLITGVKPGTATITVAAAGDTAHNSATRTLEVTVTLSSCEISNLSNTANGVAVSWTEVAGASGYYVYRKTNAAKKYTLISTVADGSTVNYTDTKVKSKNGTIYLYKVVPYSGSTIGTGTELKTVRLTAVKLVSVKNTASKKITVKWKRTTKVSGYQIQYSTSKTFASGNKTVKVSGVKKVSKVISKLTKKKTYYVRIRTYKTVNGKTYYSAWSSKKTVKIKK
ncbi:MAG: Ig-like domain-containing protein [Clostridiales bacterium]|nr:Ig-like domain-containing protein [Clostridiales bacterium]